MTKRRSIIIISTGRTGTKYFAKLFNGISDDVESYHASQYTPFINILSNMVLSNVFPKYFLKIAWYMLKSKELSCGKKRIYVDSNNHLFAIPYLLPNLYPNLRIVHVIRDPRNYVRSHLNWACTRKKSRIANFVIPFWQPNAFLTERMNILEWLHFSTFERFCWIWKYKNELMAEAEQIKATPYLVLRFEDYFSETNIDSLNKLFTFCDIKINTDKIKSNLEVENQSLKNTVTKWTQWSVEDCARLDSICGDLMKTYGYGQEEEWLKMVKKGNECTVIENNL